MRRNAARYTTIGDGLGTLLLMVIAAMLSATLMSVRFSRVERSAGSALLDATQPAKGFTAVIVAQSKDCDGNLGVFGLFERPSISSHVPHRVLLVEGQAQDTLGLRDRLPRSLQQATLSVMSSTQRATMVALGHRSTPTLLLFDAEYRLRYAGASPPGPVERTVELSAIARLVTNNPNPLVP
jgi:hypothetical protein